MPRRDTLINKLAAQGKDATKEVGRLIELYSDVQAVSEVLNVSGSTVVYHLRKGGYTRGWYQIPDDRIISKYVELQDASKVANHFGISELHVKDVLIQQLASEPNE